MKAAMKRVTGQEEEDGFAKEFNDAVTLSRKTRLWVGGTRDCLAADQSRLHSCARATSFSVDDSRCNRHTVLLWHQAITIGRVVSFCLLSNV
jgi:hypothetical protein